MEPEGRCYTPEQAKALPQSEQLVQGKKGGKEHSVPTVLLNMQCCLPTCSHVQVPLAGGVIEFKQRTACAPVEQML